MIDMLLATLAQAATRPPMVEKLEFIVPEIIMFIATVVVMIVGLSPNLSIRRLCAPIAIIGLIVAGVVAYLKIPEASYSPMPGMLPFAKVLIAGVGVLLMLVLTGTVDRGYEAAVSRGMAFDGIRSTRAEFYAFALFSLTGLMLTASADDLIWIFLALELTSLPTYVMVSISTPRAKSQEAGVKYFFLGALGAATFLYGFALLYGATGTTSLFGSSTDSMGIMQVLAWNVAETGSIGTLATIGMVMSVVGVSFKIAAVPMHFYAADVYEGAATSVSAFLAFVPKAAGFITLFLLLSCVGWGFEKGLPEELRITLWVMAALSMTVGNVMALLQKNVKRILAYSSIAHSGYMLVGLVSGPGDGSGVASNGLGATMFYLLCYGVMNLGAFGVLACLERGARDFRNPERPEIETVDDLKGLCTSHPALGWTMVLCAFSLAGIPPLLGFFGKFYLFTSALAAGEITLLVILCLNSAIAVFYYLQMFRNPLLEKADASAEPLEVTDYPGRIIASVFSAASVIVLVFPASRLMNASANAVRNDRAAISSTQPQEQADEVDAVVKADR